MIFMDKNVFPVLCLCSFWWW